MTKDRLCIVASLVYNYVEKVLIYYSFFFCCGGHFSLHILIAYSSVHVQLNLQVQ